MIILGVDPGQSGGIARLQKSYVGDIARLQISYGLDNAWKMPETERDTFELFLTEFDPRTMGDVFAYIERVHSMPKQGVASSFKFGQNYGFLRGMLTALSIPFEEVNPQRWQKALGCLSRGDKNVTKAKAQQLYPALKVTHAMADALLIATYGLRVKTGEVVKAEPGRRRRRPKPSPLDPEEILDEKRVKETLLRQELEKKP